MYEEAQALYGSSLIDGVFTQEQLYYLGWTKEVKCQLCQNKGTEVYPMYEYKGWKNLRGEMYEEVRKHERIALTSVSEKWLWHRGLCQRGEENEARA